MTTINDNGLSELILASPSAVQAQRSRFDGVRGLSSGLVAGLSDADASGQSMPDPSPSRWHPAHTTWFIETFVLRDFVRGYRLFDPAFAFLYNSYYEAEGDRLARPFRGMLTPASLDEVLEYRRHVDIAMMRAIDDLSMPSRDLLLLRCNNEEQHQEMLLTDLLHLFAQNPLLPRAFAPGDGLIGGATDASRWIEGRQGPVESGHDGQGFAFDCEGPRHTVWLAPHALTDRLVTNREWRAFMDDDGYRTAELWLSDGWAWVRQNRIEAPLNWCRDETGDWCRQTGLGGLVSLDPASPVQHVSYYEADAFAPWAAARLPTEAEWESAADGAPATRGVFLDYPCAVHPARARAGDGGPSTVRRPLGMAGVAFRCIPRLPPGAGRGRRVQRQIHVGSVRSERRQLRDTAWARPGELPQLLLSTSTLAIHRLAPREGRLMSAHEHALDTHIVDANPAFRRDVLNGLSARPRTIPARWFYDRNGSELFEAITELPEYYVTPTELTLLSGAVHEIAEITGSGRIIVEFGSGSSMKTRILLPAMRPAAYVPIDISIEFLLETAAKLSGEFGELPIHPVEGDFTKTLRLPAAVAWKPRLGFFPGSTIGNLLVPEAADLLRTMAATLGRGSMLLVGIDRIKDPGILLRAYDDARGVTAAFNLNLVHRINRELRGTMPVDAFRHVARWNAKEARIEMHLEASRDIQFSVDGQTFSMTMDETIHTENSHKYGARDAYVLLRAGGWTPIRNWTDSEEHFSLILATEGSAPSVPSDDRPLESTRAVFSR